ncbi:hypothetical protein EJ08DRAFT_697521 [Tothia fuscella]|uniref:Uncharacterized protein n=1 Tax=Tothia fuscella TaxID=1048955 RepID=A0A9P4NRZ6_9PEZI|nr:hypothetical protein EJ08DRAFT_697521 [Tothia fuscella]
MYDLAILENLNFHENCKTPISQDQNDKVLLRLAELVQSWVSGCGINRAKSKLRSISLSQAKFMVSQESPTPCTWFNTLHQAKSIISEPEKRQVFLTGLNDIPQYQCVILWLILSILLPFALIAYALEEVECEIRASPWGGKQVAFPKRAVISVAQWVDPQCREVLKHPNDTLHYGILEIGGALSERVVRGKPKVPVMEKEPPLDMPGASVDDSEDE